MVCARSFFITLALASAVGGPSLATPLFPGPAVSIGGSGLSMALGDFNGDGRPDLAVANGTDVSVLRGLGDGTFGTPMRLAVGDHPRSVVVADFNADGRPDLAVVSDDLFLLLGLGDGTLGLPAVIAQRASGIAVMDFNSDGRPDLAVAKSAGGITVLPGLGDGTFGPEMTVWTGGIAGAFSVGDFDGDGHPDLFVFASNIIIPSHGDGTFGPEVFVQGVDPSTRASIGDFNEDGYADLAHPNPLRDYIAVNLGLGDGRFGPEVRLGAGEEVLGPPQSITVGDLNADGHQDLAVATAGISVL